MPIGDLRLEFGVSRGRYGQLIGEGLCPSSIISTADVERRRMGFHRELMGLRS